MKIYIENKQLTVGYQKLTEDSAVTDLPSLSTLPTFIQEKINHYRNPNDRKLRTLGKLMLQKMLLETGYKELASLNKLTYNLNNKPVLPGIEFSISHSKEMVIVAIGFDRSVGVDVEFVKEINTDDYLSYFDDREIALLNITTFYTFWTRKEALAKLIGEGVFFPFKDINVIEKNIVYKEVLYEFQDLDIDENYKGSLCHKV